jgi:hypothetical protein
MHLMPSRRFFLAASVATAIGFASGADAQTSNEAVWQQFTDWLESAPQFDGPREMYNKYRAGLVANGASNSEADRQMDVIERLMRERPDAYRAMFNNIYRTDNPVFSTQPNASWSRPSSNANLAERSTSGLARAETACFWH